LRRIIAITVALVAALIALPTAANAAVTPDLTALTAPADGTLHAEWANPDDPVGFSYSAVRCSPLNAAGTPTIADMGRWLRWPGNYTTGSADTTAFQNGTAVAGGTTYRCYVTEIDTSGRVGGRSVPLDVTATPVDPPPTPSPSPTPGPTDTPSPTPSPDPTPTPSPTPTPPPGTRPAPTRNLNWTLPESSYFSSYRQDSATVNSTHGYSDAFQRFPGVHSWLVTAPPNGKARLYGRVSNFTESGTDGHDSWYGFSFLLDGWNIGEIVDNGHFFCAFTGTRYTDGQPNGPRGLAGCRGSSKGDSHIAMRTIITPSSSVSGSEKDLGGYLTNDRWIDGIEHIRWTSDFTGYAETWFKYADEDWSQAAHVRWDGPTDYWLSSGGPHFAWLGVYQGDGFSSTHRVFWGPWRVGPSRESVDPANPTP
jgi:hypothetical protein